jgi:uncharacterized repeat protein (TIGR03803 family)
MERNECCNVAAPRAASPLARRIGLAIAAAMGALVSMSVSAATGSTVTAASLASLPASSASTGPTATVTSLASFPASPGLHGASWTLTQGSDGNFYGAAANRNGLPSGGVFQVSPSGTLTDFYDFSSSLNMNPLGGVMQASNGQLYGMLNTTGTGSVSAGAIYTLTLDGQFTVLHNFAAETLDLPFSFNADGAVLAPNFVQTSNGTLYGVAYTGGTTDGGTIFSLTPSGTFTLLYTFGAFGSATAVTGGSNPAGGLVVGTDGNLYGTTRYGGANSVGTIYRMTPGGSVTTLMSFPAPATSGSCQAMDPPNTGALTVGMDGKLYGVQCAGGAYSGSGTVYSFDPVAATFTILHSFGDPTSKDGIGPTGHLALGADGNLYGATAAGGVNGTGTVFAVSPGGAYSNLYSFSASGTTDGMYPYPPIVGSDNNFYGTSVSGGTYGEGGVYKFSHLPQQDMVLSNSTTGTLDVRLISQMGTQQIVQAVAAGYYPVAVADFDGDGVPDILWTSANNDLYIWFGGKGSPTGFKAQYVGTYPAGWAVVGAGDINGDGKADIYWINPTTHQFAYWLMNGATRDGYFITSYTAGYYPIALGDFNGDGTLDVLWSSAKNDLYIWYANGANPSTPFTAAYGGTFPPGWAVVGVSDLDGDGKSDLVWQNTSTNEWGYWLMNGTQRKATATFPIVASNGQIAGVYDYYGYFDGGLADIVWSTGTNLILAYNLGTCASQCTFNYTTLTAPATGTTLFRVNVP